MHRLADILSMNPNGELPESFADAATCRTKEIETAIVFECLSIWASECPFVVPFRSKHYCRHTSAAQMATQSAAS